MFSFGLNFEMEGTDELLEQTKRLRDMYASLKSDFEHDEDDSVPHFRLYLRSEVRQTPNGPQIHFEVMNRASISAALRDRKEKIEKLLDGIDALTESAAKMEQKMNHPNTSTDFR